MNISFQNPVALSLLSPGTWKQEVVQIINNSSQVLFIYSGSALKTVDSNQEFIAQLKENKKVILLTGIESNPSVNQLASIRQGLKILPDVIIAMGGGSVIDIAKILIALDGFGYDKNPSQLLDIINEKKYLGGQRTTKGLIALPTTAGTGSELTRWATIWDTENKKKFSVEREDLYPNTALVDPFLTIGVPRSITKSTGLDALSHAIEAYWSTKSNPIVRRLSAQAITAIVNHLRIAIESPENITAREGMCLGAVLAGLAFSQTRTTACHALSYPLTVRLGIPHGIAVTISLIPIMRLNWNTIQEKDLFLSAFGASSIDDVESVLERLMHQDGLISLKNYGVTQGDMEKLLDDNDFMQARLGNNPIHLSLPQIKKIYLGLI